MLERVSRSEIGRYLGYRNDPPGAEVSALIEDCLRQLDAAASPRQISCRVECRIEGDTVRLGALSVESRSLAEHLSGCSEAYLFAATLGTGVDQLLRRYSQLRVSRATVLQAASAAMIEAWCDQCQEQLAETLDGLYLRPRFSPGYGDLPLSFQRPLLDTLEAGKRIGLGLTDSMLMTPSKSVSAIIGLTGDKKSCTVHRCAACSKLNCPFRKV
jgi:hypothetical protein